jgi:hypothetical protein
MATTIKAQMVGLGSPWERGADINTSRFCAGEFLGRGFLKRQAFYADFSAATQLEAICPYIEIRQRPLTKDHVQSVSAKSLQPA